MFPGILVGHALNSGGGWTGDVTIVDWHDTENNVASEVHVKRFKSKEVGISTIAGSIRISLRRWFSKTRTSRTTSNLAPPESRELRRGESTLYFWEARGDCLQCKKKAELQTI